MNIVPISAFDDNYIWALRVGDACAVVDPGDADPVLAYLEREKARLVAVLVTHRHGDHVGGLAELATDGIPVYGPAAEAINGVSHPLHDGDRVRLPALELELQVLTVPGHTRGHVAYYGRSALFCGDTLFACGCGRLFEGTPAQMLQSLERLAALPADTAVYCAHEYTAANIRFALKVEPGNRALQARADAVARMRAAGLPTLPSSIGLELATNPFLRCAKAEVRSSAQAQAGTALTDTLAVFTAVREWKNRG